MEQECDLDDILDLQEAITERTKLVRTTSVIFSRYIYIYIYLFIY